MVEWITDKMREDFFFFLICWIFLSTEMQQAAALSLPSHQGEELSPAARVALRRCLEYLGKGGPVVPHLTHFWTISGCRLKPSICQIFSAFAVRSKPKNLPGEEREEAEEDEKENYAYCSESKELFFSASEEMWTCGWGVHFLQCSGMPGVDLGFSAIIHEELSLLDDQRGWQY